MRVRYAEEGLVTLGPQLRFKKNTFQGLVMQLTSTAQVPQLIPNMKQVPRLRKFQTFSHALRIRSRSSGNSSSRANARRPEVDGDEQVPQQQRKNPCYRASEDPGVHETWNDDGEMGVGDRLLHLLQRWQVENVVLLVARQDDSLCGHLIGAELFKLMLEAAKLALEQYYMENIKASDAAKMELMTTATSESTPGGPYQPLSVRRQEEQKQQHAAVCLMSSDTIPSWPVKHQPTPDGGGRKGVRQGRINHFLNRKATSSNDSKIAKEPHLAISIGMNQDDHQTPEESGGDTSDVIHISGGIDWLKISRDELLKLKSIRVPVKELHYLFMCLIVLLEKPQEKIVKAKPTLKMHEEFTPANFSWMRCRDILQQAHVWSEHLRDLHGAMLMKSQVTALRAVFQEPSFNEVAFIRISVASVKIFTWLQRLLDEYDEMELGLLRDQGPQMLPTATEAHSPSSPPSKQRSPNGKQTQLQPRPPPVAVASASHNNDDEQRLANEFYRHASKPPKTKIVDPGRLFLSTQRGK
uniref:Uncharacterized protein n=1 Tax=Globisporangium ultimum (strain ATCC 200006 / CBS 805.95 / DAOM BR144) TaxID=431595 RepID=K3X7A5_GLOUD